MTIDFDEDGVADIIDNHLDSIVRELTPLAPNEWRWKYTPNIAKEITSDIKKNVDSTVSEAIKDYERLEKELDQFHERLEEALEENKSLKAEIEDLNYRIAHPGAWQGRKFGL